MVAGWAAASEPSNFKILKLHGNNVRWQKAAEGSRTVTYSLVAGAVEFTDARNCRKMTGIDGLVASSRLTLSAVRDEIAAAFAMWQTVADITFGEALDPATADILIGAQAEPEGWAFADVFYDPQSSANIKPISRSLVCLNPAKRWKIGFDGDLKTYDLRYTLAHEIGHAIGLDHPNDPVAIMGYRYEERFRDLQAGDVDGAVALYGARAPVEVAVEPDASKEAAHAEVGSQGLGTRALKARSR